MGPKSSLGRRKRVREGGWRRFGALVPRMSRYPRPSTVIPALAAGISTRTAPNACPRIRRPKLNLEPAPGPNRGPKRRPSAARRTGVPCERALAGHSGLWHCDRRWVWAQIKFGATEGCGHEEGWGWFEAWVPRTSRYPRRSAGMTEKGSAGMTGEGTRRGLEAVWGTSAANGVGYGPQIKFGATEGRGHEGGWGWFEAWVPRTSRYPRRSAGMTEKRSAGMTGEGSAGMTEKGSAEYDGGGARCGGGGRGGSRCPPVVAPNPNPS